MIEHILIASCAVSSLAVMAFCVFIIFSNNKESKHQRDEREYLEKQNELLRIGLKRADKENGK